MDGTRSPTRGQPGTVIHSQLYLRRIFLNAGIILVRHTAAHSVLIPCQAYLSGPAMRLLLITSGAGLDSVHGSFLVFASFSDSFSSLVISEAELIPCVTVEKQEISFFATLATG